MGSAPSCSSTRQSKRVYTDRFIPASADASHFEVTTGAENATDANSSPAGQYVKEVAYRKELANTLLGGQPPGKVLSFSPHAPPPPDRKLEELCDLYRHNCSAGLAPKRYRRHIATDAERILDAPKLLDDFYLNLLDWSSTNILSIALGDSIYLWDARDGKITQLVQTASDTHVTSLCFLPGGSQVAVGTSDHLVMVWDVEKLAQVRSMTGHSARVASLSPNGRLLSSGGRDSVVLHHDVRAAEHRVGCLKGHAQEVCGLKWSPSGQQLASGGNDNILNVWDERTVRRPFSAGGRTQTDTPLYRFDAHQAAVKALAWCPWQKHLLASGGGTADRTIRFWNTQGGTCLQGIDTKSQVCALQWAKHEKELVSAHGYSHNQVALWKYPSMVKAAELTGHTSRVLHMAQSPDGQTVVTAAADETLRFWKILSGDAAAEQEKHARASSLLTNAVLAVR